MSIQERIDKLYPFVSEDFLTYKEWQDDIWCPYLTVWQFAKTEADYDNLVKRMDLVLKTNKYTANIKEEYNTLLKVYRIVMHPKFKRLKGGGAKYTKPDWSIEEMIDALLKFVNKRYDDSSDTE